MTITPEQLAKLPKWAREEITGLTRKIEILEDDLRHVHTLSRPATDVSSAAYWTTGGWREIPSTRLRLRDHTGWVSVAREEAGGLGPGGVVVETSYTMQLEPRVGNRVLVRDTAGYTTIIPLPPEDNA